MDKKQQLQAALSWWATENTPEREIAAFKDGFYAATKKNPPETAPKDRRILVEAESGEFYCVHLVQNPYTGNEAWLICYIDDENQALLEKITCWYELPGN